MSKPTTFQGFTRSARALGRATVFFLKVFPMLPSRPVDWVTQTPRIDAVRYPARDGMAEGELYRPASDGPHPGILVCLGVVPFGQNHPQVAVLGNALARAGFAALLYWSPAMRDLRLDPEDVENIPLAYDWLVSQPYVDAARSGMIGTCVGGSFALMAAAHPLIRERISFVSAYAPYSSLWTFARDIASSTRTAARTGGGDPHEPWQVDQLTRKVFVHSLAALLEPDEAGQVLAAFHAPGGSLDGSSLSAEGQAICALLSAPERPAAEAALRCLPPAFQARLDAISPARYLADIHAPLMILLHDRGDNLIPIGESWRLIEALDGRAGVQFTEMQFQHLDPIKGNLPMSQKARELWKFLRAMYPLFLHITE